MGRMVSWLAALAPAAALALAPQASVPADVRMAHAAMPAQLPQDPAARQAFVKKYCVSCHNSGAKVGGLALDSRNFATLIDDAAVWEKVVRKTRAGMMPPTGVPRPNAAELKAFYTAIELQLDREAAAHPDPGGPSLHRLNRTEYANAIRDLLDLDADVSTLLPADDSSDGFDNIADVLGVSPSLIQGYVSAAMKLSRLAVGDRTMVATRATYRADGDLSQDRHIEGLPLGTRGGMLVKHNFPLDAEYDFIITGGAGFAGLGVGAPRERSVDVDVTLNGEPVKAQNTNRFTIPVKAGPQVIGVSLVDRQRPAGVDDIYSVYGVGGGVQSVVIIGPKNAAGPGDTPSRRKIFVCHPKTPAQETPCAKKILASLATHAFRRPVREGDPAMKPLLDSYQEGRKAGDFEVGIQHALARVLVAPRFLYRIEADRPDLPAGAVYRIADLELASRLSFFLWSTLPDDELMQLAARKQLSRPEVLEKQVRRMLADPRAEALVRNFGGQWLQLRDLANAQPDVRDWDANLRESFRSETEMLFASVMREDRKVTDLLDADYTFVDERLARHYGIEGVHGSYMRRVSLPADSPRRGLLGQGSILTVTSVADRTSPVSRGKWVVENILGAPVPAPPPGVEQDLNKTAAVTGPTTLRKRMELHRADPTCASCHRIMDPIGFAMEPFDLTGKWRATDGGLPIDASGTLVDGTPLNGPASLRSALLARSDAFVQTMTEKMMTYALGRTLRPSDMPAARAAVREAAARDYRFSAVVLSVVKSPPFLERSRKPPDGAPARTIATNSKSQPVGGPASR
jgi:mono/diheme cytochrome c family protein